ncbi:hypothetical protein [Ochrovirga pacifica]|uniref:hypothetical protein n=1 Tax=Ochrovirga pacifica TaxID=1042376 RepID=UPI000255A533|nr:hypothetical protein [Ochrovirga pacifica]
MQQFTEILKHQKTEQLSVSELETLVAEFPYFQLAKALLLQKYRNSQHFKYNNALKNLAAHTVDREVLFDFISQIEEAQQAQNKAQITKTAPDTPLATETQEVVFSAPLEFTSKEKHSFKEWLQLSHQKTIERNPTTLQKETPKPLETKLNIIDQFLMSNPKISRPIKNIPTSASILSETEDPTHQLMTETLAKVYIAQKKYSDAIQAYKILSLKYPEKSSFFANQIEKIEILQKNKS